MPELTMENNPYRANRPWPPNFEKLGQKHQFRLERKYRRRLRNASIRPNWIKGVKLLQYGACSGVVIFSVFFMDWTKFGYKPFEGVRTRFPDKESNSNDEQIRGWAKNAFNVLGSPPEPSLRRIKDQPTQPPDQSGGR